MNLYELAESLESWANDVYGGGKTITDAANMLRQQQTEIKALHNLVKEQDKKIIDLAFKLAYAERSVEIVYSPKKHGLEE